LSHSEVQRPLLPAGYSEPGGSSLPRGTRRQVRVTQSREGEATTTSDAAGIWLPRSQTRPTGSPPQAVTAATNKPRTTTETRRLIAGDNRSPHTRVKRSGQSTRSGGERGDRRGYMAGSAGSQTNPSQNFKFRFRFHVPYSSSVVPIDGRSSVTPVQTRA